MDRGATAGDYTVHVGKGVCVVGDTHLTESVLFCQTPGPIPDKSEGNKDKSHRIVVSIDLAHICKYNVSIFMYTIFS